MASETATIAKTVRSEVRAAVKAGTVKLPAGARLSVRSDQFSMGASVDINVRGASQEWKLTENDQGNLAVSPAAWQVGQQLAEILRRHLTWQWGGVYADGLVLESVARRGWAPGQD